MTTCGQSIHLLVFLFIIFITYFKNVDKIFIMNFYNFYKCRVSFKMHPTLFTTVEFTVNSCNFNVEETCALSCGKFLADITCTYVCNTQLQYVVYRIGEYTQQFFPSDAICPIHRVSLTQIAFHRSILRCHFLTFLFFSTLWICRCLKLGRSSLRASVNRCFALVSSCSNIFVGLFEESWCFLELRG